MKIAKTKSLIIGNWKNEPNTLAEAKRNFNTIKSKKINTKKVIPVIAPPLVYLSELKRSYRGSVLNFASQNVYTNSNEPKTGETTLEQIRDLDIKFCIVGHAERRSLGETNEMISEKVRDLIDNKITPVLCVGEVERDDRGEYLKFVEQQIVESLSLLKKKEIKDLVIAYEPVWTIGKGNHSISSHEIHKMVVFIKKVLVSGFDKKVAMEVPIIYGGSVDEDNCNEILEDGEVKGLLIGRASSNPHSFVNILKKLS